MIPHYKASCRKVQIDWNNDTMQSLHPKIGGRCPWCRHYIAGTHSLNSGDTLDCYTCQWQFRFGDHPSPILQLRYYNAYIYPMLGWLTTCVERGTGIQQKWIYNHSLITTDMQSLLNLTNTHILLSKIQLSKENQCKLQ